MIAVIVPLLFAALVLFWTGMWIWNTRPSKWDDR